MHCNGRDTIVSEHHNISEELEYAGSKGSYSSKSENEEEVEDDSKCSF